MNRKSGRLVAMIIVGPAPIREGHYLRWREVISTKRFDILSMKAYGYGQREKNVFYAIPEFKMRVISLGPGESMPKCDMASYVIFVGVEGEAEVDVGTDRVAISRGQCLVTEPAKLSMRTNTGARLLGIQVAKGNAE
jgi:mannose-6-phosphate isomerase-like protein (cupin superfamily)